MNLFNKGTATHQWVASSVTGCFVQLRYYKRHKGAWRVFSQNTGWRISCNPSGWFKQEKEQGYFVKLNEEERGQLTK